MKAYTHAKDVCQYKHAYNLRIHLNYVKMIGAKRISMEHAVEMFELIAHSEPANMFSLNAIIQYPEYR